MGRSEEKMKGLNIPNGPWYLYHGQAIAPGAANYHGLGQIADADMTIGRQGGGMCG
jgi:hypothetical protein